MAHVEHSLSQAPFIGADRSFGAETPVVKRVSGKMTLYIVEFSLMGEDKQREGAGRSRGKVSGRPLPTWRKLEGIATGVAGARLFDVGDVTAVPLFKSQGSVHRVPHHAAATDFGMSLLMSDGLVRFVSQHKALKIASMWPQVYRVAQESLSELDEDHEWITPIEVHDQITQGLPGSALYLAMSMGFDSFEEAQPHFGITKKTARQRLGGRLTPDESERALRLARALGMAAHVFGDADSAREYLRTSNFALGGKTPLELLTTSEGESIVLNEIQTYAEGGPV